MTREKYKPLVTKDGFLWTGEVPVIKLKEIKHTPVRCGYCHELMKWRLANDIGSSRWVPYCDCKRERKSVWELSERFWDKTLHAMRMYLGAIDVHEVCYFCRKDCKQPFTRWSGQMPPNIYCEDYDGD